MSSSKNTLLGIPKLPPQALFFLIPLFLSFIMSGIVSFISLVRSLGFNAPLLSPWLDAWMLSWLIAFPTVLLVLPMARKLAMSLVRSDQ